LIRTADYLIKSWLTLICVCHFFQKKVAQKTSADKKSPENAGTFIEGIELVPTSRDSNNNSFPSQRPVIFFNGDFSNAAKDAVVL
jgi:hypothetical protein